MDRTKLMILGGIAGALLLGLLVFFLFRGLGGITKAPQPVYLQFWGVYDNPSYYADIIRAYEKINPTVHINYRLFSFADYEKQLVDAFAAGTGPDIWLMHNTWLPKHGDKIQPLPQAIPDQKQPLFTIKDFQDQFIDVTLNDLTLSDQIYALPLYADTLALYYNKEMFNTAGIATPPATWNEFNDTIKKLTKLDNRGGITQAGAALGTAKNINRSTDILSLLMLQSGVQMTDAENTAATFASAYGSQRVGEVALQYYTDFANQLKQVFTWDNQQHYSVDAFVEGRAAMMLNYSHQILTLRAKAPRFNFTIAPVPQLGPTGAEGLAETQTAVNYANYWAPTVAKQSKNAVEAWKFLVYLSSAETAKQYLAAASRPAARRDLIAAQITEPEIGVFAKQALSARSWYQADNNEIEAIFAEMIDDVNFGRASIRDALQSAESKVNVLMQKNRR
ncbi:MAG: sugar ABC transporter substrate-binding protein [Patescibacteria group bacterium]